MQPGFFPPINAFFDGTRAGEEGEAIADGSYPEYYEFTVEGADAFERFGELRFQVITRNKHAAAGHTVSVQLVEDDGEKLTDLPFDFYDRELDPSSDEPTESDTDSVGVGEAGKYLGHVGDTGMIVVDLSDVPTGEVRTFRIAFDYRSHRSKTALDSVELRALTTGE